MKALRHITLALVPALLLAASCGGGDDDDDGKDSGGDDGGSTSSSSSPGTGSGSGSGSGPGNKKVEIPAIKDGTFATAKVHIEVSGGKTLKLDLDGSGIALNKLAMITVSTPEASVQVVAQGDSKDEPGAVSFTTKELSTAAGFGEHCSVKITDGDKELKGEFDCGEVDAIEPGTVKTYRVKLKGTFSATR